MTTWPPMRSIRRAAGSAGFMLLEALIAVAIMALVLSVLPAGIVMSRQTLQKSADLVGARLVAESVLANEFTGPAIAPGTRTGTLDGFSWATLVRPRESLQQAYPARGWTPYDVIVSVEVPRGPVVTVETLRLGRTR